MLENPRFIDNGKDTKTAFDVNAKILEINSKSGLYPLYMAYTIYRNELKRQLGKMTATTIDVQKRIWDRVVAENIFVVCKTPMAASITKRTLMGFRSGVVHAKFFENLETVIADEPETFVNSVKQGRTFWNVREGDDMKFNAVVGNPPYQIVNQGDGNGADPIYHLFIDVGRKLADMGTLIHPARCLFNAGGHHRDEQCPDQRYRPQRNGIKKSLMTNILRLFRIGQRVLMYSQQLILKAAWRLRNGMKLKKLAPLVSLQHSLNWDLF